MPLIEILFIIAAFVLGVVFAVPVTLWYQKRIEPGVMKELADLKAKAKAAGFPL